MALVIKKMAQGQFYAQIYAGMASEITLDSPATTQSFRKRFDTALEGLYKAIEAFMDQAKDYFNSKCMLDL